MCCLIMWWHSLTLVTSYQMAPFSREQGGNHAQPAIVVELTGDCC